MHNLKIYLRRKLIFIIDFILIRKCLFTKKESLLIIRLDDIGDYILFRNFIEPIRNSAKFKNKKIYLAGNEKWKDLTESYDKAFYDKIVWINLKRFRSRSGWSYKYSVLLKIYLLRCETVFVPNDTTNEMINFIISRSGIKEIISNTPDSIYHFGDIDNFKSKSNGSFENYLDMFFQFNRNKKFTEKLISQQINFSKPFINGIKKFKDEEYIVIFPGAGDKKRQWGSKNFRELCEKIQREYKFKIYICGDKSDSDSAREIINASKGIEDYTGKTTLTELANIIAGAKLLISNETCAVHLAASVNTKTICISNGNHFGRFNPYPQNICDFIYTVYPEEVKENLNDFIMLAKKYHIKSDLSLSGIKTDEVFEVFKKIMDKSNLKNGVMESLEYNSGKHKLKT